MKTIINWKVFFILWIAAILATLLVVPYTIGMLPQAVLDKIQIPLPTLITLQTVQVLVLFAVAIFGGLFFAGRVGLRTPILDSVTRGEPSADKVRAILPASIILGVVSTLVLLGLEFFYFQ